MMLVEQNQDRRPTGFDQQVASVQASTTATEMWYPAAYLNDTAPAVRLGSVWDDNFGNWFMYVQAQASLTVGQLVSFQAPTTGTVTAAGSTTSVLNTNLALAKSEVGNYIFTLDAAGQTSSAYKQALRRIKANTLTGTNDTVTVSLKGSIYGNNISDPDTLARVPADGSNLSIIRPWQVISATASTAPVGVALGTITASTSTAPIYTIIQVAGLAMVQAATCSTNVTVVGKSVQALAAGALSGWTNAGVTAANLGTVLGSSIYPQYAHTSDTNSLIPCFVNFLGT